MVRKLTQTLLLTAAVAMPLLLSACQGEGAEGDIDTLAIDTALTTVPVPMDTTLMDTTMMDTTMIDTMATGL